MEKSIENVIEFLTGNSTCTVTFSSKRHANKVKTLAKQFPTEIQIVATNSDGSIVAHLPVSLISIRSPRKYQKEED